MKEKHKEIWDLALIYQDARDDKGHAEIVTYYATKLSNIEGLNDDVVIPSAILHDIGWSQLSKKERFSIFDKGNDLNEILQVRLRHQDEGVKLAKIILSKVNYDSSLVDEILEVISQHDTRKFFISKNEAAMRDADKLWRFSKIGFWDDVRHSKITQSEYCEILKSKMEMSNFLYFDSSKKIAMDELEKRKSEVR